MKVPFWCPRPWSEEGIRWVYWNCPPWNWGRRYNRAKCPSGRRPRLPWRPIARENEANNAFITVLREQALAEAETIQQKITSGELTGPLAGVPMGIKDNICTWGVKTTCASKILGDFRPAYDATVMEKLHQAGGVMVGKLNMDEFAMGSTSETSFYGATKNPGI